mmetsp:Transcript_62650/g.76696  ORF Transcript_62650/g.76696 Transcript_62650/m.76696 type:complete len:434 (-) Transcript_62650:306-1607(-)
MNDIYNSNKMSFLFVILITAVTGQSFLGINNVTNQFEYRGNDVFLSGANQAWVQYGQDFGNNQSNAIFCALNNTLHNISESNGNILREWLFTTGNNGIPLWNNNGEVIGTDASNSLIDDLILFLKAAANANVFVLLTLWNGADPKPLTANLQGLMKDTAKLQTFIDNALTPMVKALADMPALAGYEIINEPCGSVLTGNNGGNECTNTESLSGSGADWTNTGMTMENIQRFINLQTSAIKNADPKALVTVGIWNEHAGTDEFGYTNYFKDECLINAGGKSNGVLDYQQFHTYSFNGKYDTYSPVNVKANQFGLNKPLLVGEFQNQLTQYPYNVLYPDFYNNGYNGGLAWCMNYDESQGNGFKQIDVGMNSLNNKNNIKVNIAPKFNLPGRCWCSDIPPDNSYTCQQQASWGKCNESWMQGYCCQSCNACQGCS